MAILAAAALGTVLVSSCSTDPAPPEATPENPRVFTPRYNPPAHRADGEITTAYVVVDSETGCEYILIPDYRGDSISPRIGKDRLPICNSQKESE